MVSFVGKINRLQVFHFHHGIFFFKFLKLLIYFPQWLSFVIIIIIFQIIAVPVAVLKPWGSWGKLKVIRNFRKSVRTDCPNFNFHHAYLYQLNHVNLKEIFWKGSFHSAQSHHCVISLMHAGSSLMCYFQYKTPAPKFLVFWGFFFKIDNVIRFNWKYW